MTLDFVDNRFETRVSCSISHRAFYDTSEFAILSEATNFDLIDLSFEKVRNIGLGHSACDYCLVDTINNGNYNLIKTTFYHCDANDNVIIDISFVNLIMRS